MAITLTATRTLLPGSLSPISLTDPANQAAQMDSIDLGQPGNIIEWAESRFSDGATPIAKRLGRAQGSMAVECWGTTHANCQTRIDELVDTFNQLTFNLSLVADAATYTWKLYAATSIGVDLKAPFQLGFLSVVRLSFDRSPTPVAGPW